MISEEYYDERALERHVRLRNFEKEVPLPGVGYFRLVP